MSTWETNYFDVAICPCTSGKVQRVVESPDNPWSRVSISYRLDCDDCNKHWDVSDYNGTLTDKATHLAAAEASAASRAADEDVFGYLNSLLQEWPFPSFKTKGAEFDYLAVKRLYKGTVGQYRYARRTKTMKELAKVWPSSPFITELVEKQGSTAEYNSRTSKAQAANQNAEAKSKAVKRIHLPV